MNTLQNISVLTPHHNAPQGLRIAKNSIPENKLLFPPQFNLLLRLFSCSILIFE